MKTEKFHFAPNLCGVRKKVREKNCSFRKALQMSFYLFFYRSYLFSFIPQKHLSINQKFKFPAEIYKTQKKC